jgi:hypothetical protein
MISMTDVQMEVVRSLGECPFNNVRRISLILLLKWYDAQL